MLFDTKIARLDTGTYIFYLTTRARDTDQRDWLKMVHMFKYARGTKDLPLFLSVDKSGIIKWYIFGSYAVDPNMRRDTGGVLKMGQGFPIVASIKQKLNTSSSIKSEIVGVDQLMP